jgi:hypothetical protein
MGRKEFYAFGGTVERIPCTVKDYVFDDFNLTQAGKVFGASNAANSEVWWFYPSSTSSEIDRYVVFNYVENLWYYGTLNRTAWIDRGIFSYPLAASTDSYVYEQEVGFNDGSTNPPSAITSYIESAPMDISDGEQFMFIDKMIPDLSFENSTATDATVAFAVTVKDYPYGTYSDTTSGSFVRTQTTPVTLATELIYYRLRGRQMSMKLSSTTSDMTWRLGTPRINLRPDGRR